MEKKYLLKRFPPMVVIMSLMLCLLLYSLNTPYEVKAISQNSDYAASQWTVLKSTNIIDKLDFSKLPLGSLHGAVMKSNILVLPVQASFDFDLIVPETGEYNIILGYKIDSDKVLSSTVTLNWDGGQISASAPQMWEDNTQNYEKDRYGNDIIPDQKVLNSMHYEYLKSYSDIDKSPIGFKLIKGMHKFTLTNNTEQMSLQALYLVKKQNVESYNDYIKAYPGNNNGNDMITIEAEKYTVKSDSFIRAANVQNPALTPYNTYKKLLNVIDDSWTYPGQKIMWTFEVKTPGLYKIGCRYAQSITQGMSVFRNIEIDGSYPFKEMKDSSFKYTGFGFSNLVIGDQNGQAYKVWLGKGLHTITMEADAGPVKDAVNILNTINTEINDTGIDIKKLTGGKYDPNRTWDVKGYMPDIVDRLEGWNKALTTAYKLLAESSNGNPTFAVNLKVSSGILSELAKDPNKIPNSLSKLSDGSGSVAQMVSELAINLSYQPLSLDRIYIFSGQNLPGADAGIMRSMFEGFKRFVSSFFQKENKASGSAPVLNVWVNRPRQYVNLLQEITDSDFTPKSGIKVKYSILQDEQKLTLAIASGTNPDAALGISTYIPYQLAIRKGVYDLTQFEDFLPYISREHNLETLIPYDLEGKIYGVTETQDFFVLMYRKDILDKLKLPVPKTWEEVEEIMPELERHSMNFYLPMAAWQGLKPFYTTAPFIFQNNGDLYTKDGLKTTINSENSIKGIETMTELFNIYSVAKNIPNFYNNFRYGIIPIGVSNFNSYIGLSVAAPELANKWALAPAPGIKDSNGNINNVQTASERADIVFSNSKNKNEAWELLKWWLSKNTQLKYAYDLQTKYGPEYMWNTSNLAAFEELPIPEKDKKIILAQWKTIKEVPQHPAGYMVERELSNAWTDIVMNGVNTRIAVDKAALNSNREIQKKLEEFGYIVNGKVISGYHIATVDDIKKRVRESK